MAEATGESRPVRETIGRTLVWLGFAFYLWTFLVVLGAIGGWIKTGEWMWVPTSSLFMPQPVPKAGGPLASAPWQFVPSFPTVGEAIAQWAQFTEYHALVNVVSRMFRLWLGLTFVLTGFLAWFAAVIVWRDR